MTVKHSLLLFLSEGPLSASELHEKFEQEMSGAYTLNKGQVSQTMSRLLRDALVEAHDVAFPNGRTVAEYSITEAGLDALNGWWSAPIEQPSPIRDELVIKFALAARRGEEAFIELLDSQRFATLRQLRELSTSANASASQRTAHRLLLERRIFELEAILRWLDCIEALFPIEPTNHDTAGPNTANPAHATAKDQDKNHD